MSFSFHLLNNFNGCVFFFFITKHEYFHTPIVSSTLTTTWFVKDTRELDNHCLHIWAVFP